MDYVLSLFYEAPRCEMQELLNQKGTPDLHVSIKIEFEAFKTFQTVQVANLDHLNAQLSSWPN